MTAPAPLALYVHWPYCRRICPYCDFNVKRDRGGEEPAALARAIVTDLQRQGAELAGPRRLTSIYFGGGTPSLMDPAWVAEIVEAAQGLWPADPALEVTLEANPTDAEAGRYAAFAAGGVGRLSLGVQSLDDAALRFLGRDHTAAEACRAAQAARRAFPRLSLDLIYGWPGQTAQAWRAELADALSLGPEHVSAYQLTLEAGTAFGRLARRGRLAAPEEALGADLYEIAGEVLTAAGFEAYEVSNHARGPAARSRHNLAYWRGWEYLGVGPGAHGRLAAAAGRLATVTAKRPADYIARLAAGGSGVETATPLAPGETAEERLLSGLRTLEGVDFADLLPLGLAAGHPKVTELANAGLVEATSERICATAAGRLLLDRVTSELALV